jgi:hypothetical protein
LVVDGTVDLFEVLSSRGDRPSEIASFLEAVGSHSFNIIQHSFIIL